MAYKLLEAFADLFSGKQYRHRASNQGDLVARYLFEDLYEINRSKTLMRRVDDGISVLNARNTRQGVRARRGDGSFGEILPNVDPIEDPGFIVKRGPIATIEVGIEVKMMMKAMIKQIDRVQNDLRDQARHFRSKGGKAFCVGIVGINQAPHCTSYEGARETRTDGKKHKHPASEAAEAERRLRQFVEPSFDEFLVLPFVATNEPPYSFAWVNAKQSHADYGASLVRICQHYEANF